VLTRQSGVADEVRYWHKDHLDSNTVVTNETGAVVERLEYEPFGKRRKADNTTDAAGTLTAISTDRGFTAHEMLDEVGLIHMNGRGFDPAIGRFLSADPTVPHPNDMQSYNHYSYTRNRPLSSVDPSGFDDWLRRNPELNEGSSAAANLPFIMAGMGGAGGSLSATTFNSTSPGYDLVLTWNNSMGSSVDALCRRSDLEDRGTITNLTYPRPAFQEGVARGINDLIIMEASSHAAGKVLGAVAGLAGKAKGLFGGAAPAANGAEAIAAGSVKGGVAVTDDAIRAALKTSDFKSAQGAISRPAVENYVRRLEAGEVAPAIKVDGKVIVDGNHRYVAGRLVGKEPAQTAGSLSASQVGRARPVQELKIDPTDWGNR
jgi:RHS repeat-associated protein